MYFGFYENVMHTYRKEGREREIFWFSFTHCNTLHCVYYVSLSMAIIYLICNHCHISYTFYHTHHIFFPCICTLIFNTYHLANYYCLCFSTFALLSTARVLKRKQLILRIYFSRFYFFFLLTHKFNIDFSHTPHIV